MAAATAPPDDPAGNPPSCWSSASSDASSVEGRNAMRNLSYRPETAPGIETRGEISKSHVPDRVAASFPSPGVQGGGENRYVVRVTGARRLLALILLAALGMRLGWVLTRPS